MAKKKIYRICGRRNRKEEQKDLPDDYSFGEQYDDAKMPVVADDAGEEVSCVGQLAQMAGLSADHPLINFYMEDKASEFIDKYQPCDEQDSLSIRFPDSKLRSYFKAYVCTNGDPLKIYMMRLRLAGFYYSTDITGELVMFVKERHFHLGDTSWMRMMEESCNTVEERKTFGALNGPTDSSLNADVSQDDIEK